MIRSRQPLLVRHPPIESCDSIHHCKHHAMRYRCTTQMATIRAWKRLSESVGQGDEHCKGRWRTSQRWLPRAAWLQPSSFPQQLCSCRAFGQTRAPTPVRPGSLQHQRPPRLAAGKSAAAKFLYQRLSQCQVGRHPSGGDGNSSSNCFFDRPDSKHT